MSVRPMVLCKLEKGKLIDTQENFVDTFNWMVDYINNLRGDDSNIELTNPTTENPVIRLKNVGDDAGGGSDFNGILIKGIDKDGAESEATALSSITFTTGDDSRESFVITDEGDGNITVKLDTYWK